MDWKSPPKVDSDSAVRGFLYLVAIWGIGAGIVSLYAGVVGANVFFFLGIGAYLWIGVGQLGAGLLMILALYFRPNWFGISAQ